MRYGPVDVIVLAFGKPEFDGSVVTELKRLAGEGTIRVLDAMFLTKDDQGREMSLDLEDLPAQRREQFGFISTGTRGLFDSADADTLFEGMAPGAAILALAIEHSWARGLREALERAGAEMALDMRIPGAVVEDAYAAAVG